MNSVQEEIGLRGAEMIAQRIKPNVAIVTDVTHDTQTPMINKITQGDLSSGGGPVLSYAPAVQINLNKLLVQVAEKMKFLFNVKLRHDLRVRTPTHLHTVTEVCHLL